MGRRFRVLLIVSLISFVLYIPSGLAQSEDIIDMSWINDEQAWIIFSVVGIIILIALFLLIRNYFRRKGVERYKLEFEKSWVARTAEESIAMPRELISRTVEETAKLPKILMKKGKKFRKDTKKKVKESVK